MLSLCCPVLHEEAVSREEPPLQLTLLQPLVTDDMAATRETAQELHRPANLKERERERMEETGRIKGGESHGSHVHVMQVPCISCENHVIVMWKSCRGHGIHVHVGITWVMCESCKSHADVMCPIWESCESHVRIIWGSCDSCGMNEPHKPRNVVYKCRGLFT